MAQHLRKFWLISCMYHSRRLIRSFECMLTITATGLIDRFETCTSSVLDQPKLRRLLSILLLDAMQYPVIIEMRQRQITTDDYVKQNTKRKDSRETLIFINIECCNWFDLFLLISMIHQIKTCWSETMVGIFVQNSYTCSLLSLSSNTYLIDWFQIWRMCDKTKCTKEDKAWIGVTRGNQATHEQGHTYQSK